MKRGLRLIACLVLCLFLCSSLYAHADFGDFAGDSDYDFGDYDFDYGGSDYDYGGSDYNYDTDDDNYVFIGGPSGGGSSGSSGGFFSMLARVVVLIIIMVVLSQVVSKRKKTGQTRNNGPVSRTPVPAPGLKPISDYAAVDPGFSLAALKTKCAALYIQMQNCWTQKDISSLRPYFDDALFAQMDRQLEALRAAHRTNYVERPTVLSVVPMGFRQSGGTDTIVVQLTARITDYTLDDSTGQLISGSRNQEKFMTYQWELSRPTGTKTAEQAEMTVVNCPNCGAALNINQSAKCPYCDSVITLNQHDWVLYSIRGISQKTN